MLVLESVNRGDTEAVTPITAQLAKVTQDMMGSWHQLWHRDTSDTSFDTVTRLYCPDPRMQSECHFNPILHSESTQDDTEHKIAFPILVLLRRAPNNYKGLSITNREHSPLVRRTAFLPWCNNIHGVGTLTIGVPLVTIGVPLVTDGWNLDTHDHWKVTRLALTVLLIAWSMMQQANTGQVHFYYMFTIVSRAIVKCARRGV